MRLKLEVQFILEAFDKLAFGVVSLVSRRLRGEVLGRFAACVLRRSVWGGCVAPRAASRSEAPRDSVLAGGWLGLNVAFFNNYIYRSKRTQGGKTGVVFGLKYVIPQFPHDKLRGKPVRVTGLTS